MAKLREKEVASEKPSITKSPGPTKRAGSKKTNLNDCNRGYAFVLPGTGVDSRKNGKKGGRPRKGQTR